MKRQVLILLAFTMICFHASCENSSYRNTTSIDEKIQIKAPRFDINLDQPLEPQYAKVAPRFTESVRKYIELFMQIPGTKILLSMIDVLTYMQAQDWHDEVAMWSRIFNISLAEIKLINLAYEIQCTSLVVKNSNNTIFMGRNLDFPGSHLLSNLAVEFAFYRSNKTEPEYIYATIFAYTGINNGIVPGKLVVSLNERNTGKNSALKIARFAMGYIDPNRLMRKVVEQASSFDEAIEKLSYTPIAATCYFTLAGTKDYEGAIITRKLYRPLFIDYLTPERWFIVQTNYDRNLPDPPEDYRRVPVENKFNELGNNITYQDVFDEVMTQKPTFRPNKTIFTTLMGAKDKYFNTAVYIDR